MRSVSVIGIGETKMGKREGLTMKDLIREAGEAAIVDAGIDKAAIQAVYVGNFNGSYLCGQSQVGPMVTEVLGLPRIPSMRTEGACASGSLSFRQAMIAIAAGIYDVVLVGGVEKMTHQPTEIITSAIASAEDVGLEVAAGITFPSLFAMIANRYFCEYRNVREEMALCAVSNHYNASLNPDAQLRKIITPEMVKNGVPVASPFTVYDCSLVSDGAAFVVLAASDIARALNNGHRQVEIAGSGHGGDVISLCGKESLTTFHATKCAAREAYQQAGVTAADIQFAEVHDCFTITQIINIEDLGFFPKGHGADAVAEGKIAITGEKPINTSGGLKAKGHPIGATGLSQIFEVVTQLRGDAGERQLRRADLGLTHNLGGAAGTCLVHVFRGL